MKRFLASLNPQISALNAEGKIDLAKRLIASGYGEQKAVAIALLEKVPECFPQDRFRLLEDLISGLHGWGKIDSVTKLFLPSILRRHTQETIELLERRNVGNDRWLRRASVVLFTRKVAKSGRYKDIACRFCHALIHDKEHLVQTGVGWCLRDLMRWHKGEILPYVVELRRVGVSSKITLYALRDIRGEEHKAVLLSSA